MESRAAAAGEPVYVTIRNRLAEEIRLGRLADGALLPPEEELSDRFGTSRNTLRNALRDLREAGLIQGGQGRRSVVHNVFKGSQPRRFLWLGRRAERKDERPRALIYQALVRLIERNQGALSYWVLQSEDDEQWLAEHLDEYDGIVVADIGSSELLPELAARLKRFPNSIGTQERVDPLTRATCCSDDTAGGRIAARFLLGQGMRRMVVMGVAPNLNSPAFSERIGGFSRECLLRCDGRQQIQLCLSNQLADFTDPTALLRGLELRANRIEALFVLSDLYALRCMDCLMKMGFRIPDDISVIGIDGIDEGAAAPVPLTTVAHPFQALAERLFCYLYQPAGQSPLETLSVIPPELIVRQSVKQK